MSHCKSCLATLLAEQVAYGQTHCDACEDDATADQHDERCDCGACERVRSRYGAELRQREAATCGGLSDFGREVLGW